MTEPFDNVTRIGPPAKLKPRAEALLGAMVHAGEIAAILDRDYLVKGWLDRGTVSLIYGPSNAGKTFLALDIAQHIAKGESWGGCRVRKAPVLYVGAEGGAGIRNRIAALGEPAFWFLGEGVVLRQGSPDPEALSEAVLHLERLHGAFGLIVIDTLARAMGPADENASRDMAGFLEAVETVRRRTGAHVLVVHHTGKDAGQGARGHSSLLAHVDTAIELSSQEGGLIHAEVKKQRDARRGAVFAYRLTEVELGVDVDGDPVTTCVVAPDAPARAGRAVLKGMARTAMTALDDVLRTAGQNRTVAGELYPSGKCVRFDEWADMCERHNLSDAEDPDDRRRSIKRVLNSLKKQGHVTIIDGYVWKVVP